MTLPRHPDLTGEAYPDIVEEVTRTTKEHEFFMSFNTDEAAEQFMYWWNFHGYIDWANHFNEYLHKERPIEL